MVVGESWGIADLGLSLELSGYSRWLGYCIPVRNLPPSLVLFKRLFVHSVHFKCF